MCLAAAGLLILLGGCAVEPYGAYGDYPAIGYGYGGYQPGYVYEPYYGSYYSGGYYGRGYGYHRHWAPYDRDHYWDRDRHWERHRYPSRDPRWR